MAQGVLAVASKGIRGCLGKACSVSAAFSVITAAFALLEATWDVTLDLAAALGKAVAEA